MERQNYSKLCDQDLLLLLNVNDESAYAQIFERYHAILYQFVFRRIQDPQQSEDILQDVFISLWRRRTELSIATSLESYLFTAVRNKAFDYFAHQKIQEKYLESLQYYVQDSAQSDYLTRENHLKQVIEKEIDSLPERMQEIFRLSRHAHLSNKEISQKLALSPHTVDTQIKRALKILKGRLSPSGLMQTHLPKKL